MMNLIFAMASKDDNRINTKDGNTGAMNSKKISPDKLKIPQVIGKAARYKAALEIHGEHLEAHRNQLKEIQERHSLVTDEIIPKLSLMGEALQARMDSMQLKVDRLRDIRLEIERNQAAEEVNAKPVADETPPQRMILNPQVLNAMGLRDLSNLVSREVIKLICELAIRGAPVTTPSTTPPPPATPPPATPPTAVPLTTSPHTPSTIIQPSPELPSAPSSPQKTYKERQKERRKQKKAEKAKLQKQQALESTNAKVHMSRKLMKEKKLAMKTPMKRLRSLRIKEEMMGSRTVKVIRDRLWKIGQAIRWAPVLVWMRSVRRVDMETRWKLRTRPYAFC
ncbi:hypothetical protein F5Y00DRAFT_242133 [Daldinia vernicosa]|uniref:uncharacterized protein n=1 Tax=Daldinia vernicosa TaxID=114800 RepID=UPI002007B7D0|nr:uncharacterized protein F5Y00DRAFT_242133 [Daldinia vernicosa]KAI0847273.1 hypothetical protein F5Y00DRAFT_242133 [Daldinia vernicosa]